MHHPHVAGDAGSLPGALLNRRLHPDVEERRPDPGDAGHDMRPAQQRIQPFEDDGGHWGIGDWGLGIRTRRRRPIATRAAPNLPLEGRSKVGEHGEQSFGRGDCRAEPCRRASDRFAKSMRQRCRTPSSGSGASCEIAASAGSRFVVNSPSAATCVDFFCPAAKLIVEVDGEQHAFGDDPAACRAHTMARGAGLHGRPTSGQTRSCTISTPCARRSLPRRAASGDSPPPETG